MHIGHSGQQGLREKSMVPSRNQMGNSYMHAPVTSALDAVPSDLNHIPPRHSIEFQPSEVCPRNFIIFDQTGQRSQITYNPLFAQKLGGPSLNICETYIQDNVKNAEASNGRELSPLEEDSGEINALLSLDEEDEEECDEEEVSTARTDGNYNCPSPDSFSSYSLKSRRNNRSSSVEKSSASGSCSYEIEKKRQKMKKMMNTLREIVPGGSELNSVAVLDEAVRYLKSLKVEAQKLGVGKLKN